MSVRSYRIGQIVPSSNVTMETEIQAMLRARADFVIALYPVAKAERKACKAPLIDRRDAWKSGAHALYISRGGIRIVSAADKRGARPWS